MRVKMFIIVVLIKLPSICWAQDTLFLSKNEKEDIIYNVSKVIESKFLYEDYAGKMSVYIKNQFKKGLYDSLSEVNSFCSRITSDLRKVYNDKHLFVFYSPEETLEIKALNNSLPKNELIRFNKIVFEEESSENFGFKELKILDGNVGYLKLSYFTSPQYFEDKVNLAMSFLSHSDAIIIDLRNNGGGEGSSLLASYFLPPKETKLGCTICRDTTFNSESKNQINIKGKRFLNEDLFILTNSRTFSAAEDFSYTMKHLKRATIVGEKTKGGAHPVDILILYNDILIQLPICESYNPITKGNWEGIGVIPDISVSSGEAFNVAYIKAIENILSKGKGNKTELEIVLKNLTFKPQ